MLFGYSLENDTVKAVDDKAIVIVILKEGLAGQFLIIDYIINDSESILELKNYHEKID